MTPPVTVKELETALEVIEPQQLKTLLLVFRHSGKTVSDAVALKLCLYDWLLAILAGEADTATRLVLRFEPDLETVAAMLAEGPVSEESLYASFNLLDFRFVCCSIVHRERKGRGEFYDKQEDKLIACLPYHALTAVSCDLIVLWLRFEGRMKRIRTQQEKVHADTAACNAAENRQQPAQGDAGAPGQP